jgi:WG containing repeat
MVIGPRFDEAGAFSEGLAEVRVGKRFGLIAR